MPTLPLIVFQVMGILSVILLLVNVLLRSRTARSRVLLCHTLLMLVSAVGVPSWAWAGYWPQVILFAGVASGGVALVRGFREARNA